MEDIHVFCPATIANISCGFDVLGLALASVGDEMVVRKITKKGIFISKIEGQNLPKETHLNVAGIAGQAFMKKSTYQGGFEIEIYKQIKPGSGIGSSAASSAAVVVAMNKLLGEPFSPLQLVEFAMEGECSVSGIPHADNVSAAIFGGITLVRSYAPLDIISLNIPKEIYVTVIHPQIEIKTSDSRKVLSSNISLKNGIKQWGNLGGFIAGLYTENYELIGHSLKDYIVEPLRSKLIPFFHQIKLGSMEAGALGCGIAGSGPSIYALSKGCNKAEKVASAMHHIYDKTGIDYDIHVSEINIEGIKEL
ncbi:homoserine kinase [Arenibacter sp. M-2]|uniref:homoserine kinase n=1 Tax=Arenibacter sp. M-2 TaxID=3053612 RepID=UPI0025705D82|nr:homoserine kinase [Arenibacter sp. M-2]MDL5512509.1 homoserine kinase [Arenibacter sp. M-2]